LGNPLPIPQIDENKPPVVTAAQSPTHEQYFTSDIGGTQRPAVVSPFPIAKKIYHVLLLHRDHVWANRDSILKYEGGIKD
jgi:hypothetical protein